MDYFDKHFDLNGDGELDGFERAYREDFFDHYDDERFDREMNGDTDSDDDFDFGDLEDMDEDERREALEDAGYDPDDWDDE